MTAYLPAVGIALAALVAAGAVSAQQAGNQRVVAKLKDIEGSVLVSRGATMAAAVRDQDLQLGSRVITAAGARATIGYDKGCVIKLGENKRFSVVERVACAAEEPPLGRAATFAVLAGSRVANIGLTEVAGDVGVSPGNVITGFPPGKDDDGKLHKGDEFAQNAQRDLAKSYKNLVDQKCNVNLAGQDLGGLLLTPGVYCFPGAAVLTGELLLDAQGLGDPVFVFQVGTTLTAAPGAVVRVVNGGKPTVPIGKPADKPKNGRAVSDCRVYWQVANTVTLGPGTRFVGNILSNAGINAAANATLVSGRALALSGPVTMNTNDIDSVACFPVAAWWAGGASGPAIIGAVGVAGAIIYGAGQTGSPNVSPN